jgi:hypothetical protein
LAVSKGDQVIYPDRVRRPLTWLIVTALGAWAVGCGDDSKYVTGDPTVSMPSGAAGDAPAGMGGTGGTAGGSSAGAAGEAAGAVGSTVSDAGQD